MATILDEEYITVAEAASSFQVSQSTVWRWIDQGFLPAYRFGQRRVRIKKKELSRLITPVQEPGVGGERLAVEAGSKLGPLTSKERKQLARAIEGAKRLQARLLERRSGELFSSSTDIIHEMREERSRELE